MGEQLVPATSSNPTGHFEDVAFFRLHQRMLAAQGLGPEGYGCPDTIEVPAPLRQDAEELVATRRAAARPWGWKDPRTTLFLDFWDAHLPDARYLFVIRPPWEVVDSLFRRGEPVFRDNPRLALDVWFAYNRRIRDFIRGRAERCLIVETIRVAVDPEGLVQQVERLIGMRLKCPTPRYEPGLLTARHAATRATLVRFLQPEAQDVFDELRQLAGGGCDAGCDGPPDAKRVAEASFAEWSRAVVTAELEAERSARRASETQAQAQAEELRILRTDIAAERERERALRLAAAAKAATRVEAAEREALRLAAQLEAERETFEGLRRDLVARLEAAFENRPPSQRAGDPTEADRAAPARRLADWARGLLRPAA